MIHEIRKVSDEIYVSDEFRYHTITVIEIKCYSPILMDGVNLRIVVVDDNNLYLSVLDDYTSRECSKCSLSINGTCKIGVITSTENEFIRGYPCNMINRDLPVVNSYLHFIRIGNIESKDEGIPSVDLDELLMRLDGLFMIRYLLKVIYD